MATDSLTAFDENVSFDWRQWLGSLGPLLALVLIFTFFAVAEKTVKRGTKKPAIMLTSETFRTIAVNSAIIGICALGMTIVIISGGIDLSVGNGICLCATVLACCLKADWPPWAAALMCLATGCAMGAINGGLVSLLRVVPFIITLGTMTIYLGIGKWLANVVEKGGQTVRPDVTRQVPKWLQDFTSNREFALWPPKSHIESVDAALDFLRFPAGIWLGLILAVLVAALLRYSVFGRYVYALGSNEATARLCGINVPWNRLLVYTLSGLFVGIAGIYQFSRLRSGDPNGNSALELRVIAAVVIGGGSLSGGRGSILGTIAGAALMSTIITGCTFLEISNEIQDIVLGTIIVAAVTVDQFRQHRTA
jgi:ribose transport system permease protein